MISKRGDSSYIEFNSEKIYEDEIAPVVQQLRAVCQRHHLPMFVSVIVGNKNGETTYKNDMLSPTFLNRSGIYEDKIAEYIKVTNGYITIRDSKHLVETEDGIIERNDFDEIINMKPEFKEDEETINDLTEDIVDDSELIAVTDIFRENLEGARHAYK